MMAVGRFAEAKPRKVEVIVKDTKAETKPKSKAK